MAGEVGAGKPADLSRISDANNKAMQSFVERTSPQLSEKEKGSLQGAVQHQQNMNNYIKALGAQAAKAPAAGARGSSRVGHLRR